MLAIQVRMYAWRFLRVPWLNERLKIRAVRCGRAAVIPRLALKLALLAAAAQWTIAFVSNTTSDGTPRRWELRNVIGGVDTNNVNPLTKAIRYSPAAGAFSITNATAELEALRASFDQWQSIPGTSLRFEEGEPIGAGADVNLDDGTNAVFWATNSSLVNGGFDSIAGALAMTFSRVNAENVLLEADIVLNGTEVAWHTDWQATDSPAFWIEATLLHEIGHFIGLEHSPIGGATMFARGEPGISLQAGLSSDEIAAARALYPAPEPISLGTVRGRVTFENGGPVFGAVVVAEDQFGNALGGTVTDADGEYAMLAVPPGECRVRVIPLDPPIRQPLARLTSGPDIAAGFAQAETGFLPTQDVTITVPSGGTVDLAARVTNRPPSLRITRIRSPASTPNEWAAVNAPIKLSPGAAGLFVGVYTPDALSSGALLSITGNDVLSGASTIVRNAFPGSDPPLHLISIPVTVSAEAIPGLRTFVLTDGPHRAYANGFLEIAPPVPDDNFDGLDDRFQRRFFSRFTHASASPSADFDEDGFNNGSEHRAGTRPDDAKSVLRVEEVLLREEGAIIRWQSVPGKRYRVFRRHAIGPGDWTQVGWPVTAAESIAQLLDATPGEQVRFYRVQVEP